MAAEVIFVRIFVLNMSVHRIHFQENAQLAVSSTEHASRAHPFDELREFIYLFLQ